MVRGPRFLFLSMALIAFLLDQGSKLAILDLAEGIGWQVQVTGFFNLVLVFNRGVSFGMLGGLGLAWQPYLLAGLAVAISLWLTVWAFRSAGPRVAAAFGLIVGGALGNALDRVRIGAVVDFLDLHAAGYHWPAFNVADSALFLGVALVLLDGLFGGATKSKTKGQ
ncbi:MULTISPECIES: signal peptidase II [Limibacillus]|jgi:signal peptidase II|uniref:Lipoprotein signal peptidase n=1 Tax=Limibacillus halophilus TaxID=1579333 RepID=A0A839SWH9_9PROT|nr:signal peptidase II [Limibacillus halophilus]MBB3066034.1 signal peptidase II [Limibacillus halophilus]